MDRTTDHEPIVEGLPPPPSAEPPTIRPRRRHTLRTVLITIATTFVVLAVIGFLTEPRSGQLFMEDFEDPPIGFSTDQDRTVDLRVEGGMYRIEVKDPRVPTLARHVFSQSYDGLSFEATVVHPEDTEDDAWASVGCWAGDSAYLVVTLPSGEVGLLETISEARGERRELTDLIPVEAMRPAGEPNRLRIDCVGGRDGRATIVSAYVNGTPVASVEIDDGYDSFGAIGFFMAANEAGATFSADDVVVTATRPEPGMSPVPDLP
jgi:hypothetical protein